MADPVPATVSISPESIELTWIGDTATIVVTVLDRFGREFPTEQFSWSSADEAVAEVSAAGLVTARSVGGTSVVVSAHGLSGTVGVTVSQEPSSIIITPDQVAFSAIGDTVRLVAVVADAGSTTIENPALNWTIADPQVADVDEGGLVTALSEGTTSVSASVGQFTSSVPVEVVPVIATLTLSPDTVRFTSLGETWNVVVDAADAGGHSVASPALVWSTSDPTVVAVDSAGTLTAVGNGGATIAAAAGSVSASLVVLVRQIASLVSLEPAADTLTWLGDTIRPTVSATDSGGSEIEDPVILWAVAPDSVIAVDTTGLLTAVLPGTAPQGPP